jgi:hypothetical protein
MTLGASNVWIWIFLLVVPVIALVLSFILSRRDDARHSRDSREDAEHLMKQAPPPHLDSPDSESDERRSA